jgi:hypothetical protein
MTEDELTPYVGKDVRLHIDTSQLPAEQNVPVLEGTFGMTLKPGFPIPGRSRSIVVLKHLESYRVYTIDPEIIARVEELT